MRKRLSPRVKRAVPVSPAFRQFEMSRYSPWALISSAAKLASGRKPRRIFSCMSAGVDPLRGPAHLVAKGPGGPHVVARPSAVKAAKTPLARGPAFSHKGVRDLNEKGVRRSRVVIKSALEHEPCGPGPGGAHQHHRFVLPLAPLISTLSADRHFPIAEQEAIDGDRSIAVSRKIRHPPRAGHPFGQKLVLQGIVRA